MRLIKFVLNAMLIFNFTCALADMIETPKSNIDDTQKINAVIAECLHIKDYIINNKFNVSCSNQYLYYGTSSNFYRASGSKSNIKIANYNLLHPGTSKSLFKDYFLVAKIANNFDFISAQEVLSMIGHDADVNSSIDNLIANAADKNSVLVQNAKSIYRMPGYLKLLMELKKLDPSWSLILSPRGDAAIQGSVEEHVGFYYRSSTITPTVNEYCRDILNSKTNNAAVACMINFEENNKYISRRPLMGSFSAGSFNFTVVSSHVIFGFSGDDNQAVDFVTNVFGAKSVDEVGKSVNLANFARFGEVKLILEFIKKYSSKYNDKKVIFSSDTNLTHDLDYWGKLLEILPGTSLLITDATTISPQRYGKNNEETLGVANSYDHFVLDKKVFSSCDDGQVYNYFKSPIESDIEQTYYIRPTQNFTRLVNPSNNPPEETPVLNNNEDDPNPPDDGTIKLDYPLTKVGEAKMNHFIGMYQTYFDNLFTASNGKIVKDDFKIAERIDGLKNRLFLKQLTNPFYYRFYQELLSDHFPAYITCKTN